MGTTSFHQEDGSNDIRVWDQLGGADGRLIIDPTPYFDPDVSKPYEYLNLFSDAVLSSETIKSKDGGENGNTIILDLRANRKLRYSQVRNNQAITDRKVYFIYQHLFIFKCV